MPSFMKTTLTRATSEFAPKRGKFRLVCAIGACALLLLSPAAAQQRMGANDRGAVENATFTSGIADGSPTDFRHPGCP